MTNIYTRRCFIINYYNEIKDKLIDDEVYTKVKDYSKERHRVITYYEVGKILFDAGKNYGESIIKQYSIKLSKELGKKYSYRTLFRMRQFYEIFSNKKVSPMGTQLTWSHYRTLLSIKDENKINYYMNKCIINYLTKRELEDIKKNN